MSSNTAPPWWSASLILFGLVSVTAFPPRPPGLQIVIVAGSNPDGSATGAWLEVLRQRLGPESYDSVAGIRRVRSLAEAAWAQLIATRAAGWPEAVASMPSLFHLPTPRRIRVVVGDRGGDDAFTHDSTTVGFDVAALQRTYGNADLPENSARLDRFFRHEFVHTLQKRWLARHPYRPANAIERALLDEWAEGMGNYFSLSTDWYPRGADASPRTSRVLQDLEPRFVSRMSGLACADSATAAVLLAGLSSGPFTKKWGALPVALWLLDDLQRDSTALQQFATAGPAAVWTLATRHLRGPLADSLSEARRRAADCRAQR